MRENGFLKDFDLSSFGEDDEKKFALMTGMPKEEIKEGNE